MSKKGFKQTPEHIAKRLLKTRGRKNTEETKKKISKAKFRNPTRYWLGKQRSLEDKNKIRAKMIKVAKRGEECNFWKGGINTLSCSIRKSWKYREWRDFIFKRDNYTCQECGEKDGKLKQAHHIKAFSQLLKENIIHTLEQAINCESLWDINNGITLCIECHKKTDNYLKGTSRKGCKNKQ